MDVLRGPEEFPDFGVRVFDGSTLTGTSLFPAAAHIGCCSDGEVYLAST